MNLNEAIKKVNEDTIELDKDAVEPEFAKKYGLKFKEKGDAVFITGSRMKLLKFLKSKDMGLERNQIEQLLD